jgi:hypothetical protein
MEKEPPYDNGKLVSTWEMLTKNSDNEPEVTILHKFDYEPEATEYSFLSQASPTIINSEKIAPRRSKELIVVPINDIHFGYRKEGDILIPTHSPEALDKILQLCQKTQPNEIVINGDGIDLPELGKYELDGKSLVDTTQASLDGLHKFLSMLRCACPNSKMLYLEANHELRASKHLIRNSMPLFGIRQANMPDDFAVNSIPNLLRLKELEIEYISGYPANSYDVNDRLKMLHGEFASKPSTATRYLSSYACSIYFAHSHRTEVLKRITPDGRHTTAFNAGCACDTTGSMPSTKNGMDLMGRVVRRPDNWQKGVAVIETKKGDKPFTFDLIDLDNETMRYQGKVYKARQEVIDALS